MEKSQNIIWWNYKRPRCREALIYRDRTPIGELTVLGHAVFDPHVEWLPAARKRDIVRGIMAVLLDLQKIRPVMITARKAIAPSWDIWVKRGLLRKVGILEGVPALDEIHIYQVNAWQS